MTFCHLTLQNILRQFLMQTSPSLQNVVHMTVPVRIIQDNTTKSQRSMIGFKISLLQAARKEKREKRGEEPEPKKVQEARNVGMPLKSVASTRISAYISAFGLRTTVSPGDYLRVLHIYFHSSCGSMGMLL